MVTMIVEVTEKVTRKYTVQVPEGLGEEETEAIAEEKLTSGMFTRCVDTSADIDKIISIIPEDQS